MSKTGSSRWLGLALAAVLAFAPALAEAAARSSGGGGFGSRGARTQQAAPPTQTAPAAAPVQRTQTPATAQRPGAPAAAPAAQGSWFQRNPFMAGMMGGLLGAGLIGMMMGGGLFEGLGSLAGMLGLLLQVALIGGIVFLVMRLLRRRQPAMQHQAAYAGLPQVGGTPGYHMRAGGGGVGASVNRDEIGIGPDDYQAFEQLLGRIQMAWSVNDQRALAQLTTPEMLSYFAEELDRMAAAGLVNHQEDGKLLQGDLSEAWSEGARQYATVAMRWTARDWVEDRSGRVVEGNRDMAQERTEVWTFVRVQGQAWVLSAVQPV